VWGWIIVGVLGIGGIGSALGGGTDDSAAPTPPTAAPTAPPAATDPPQTTTNDTLLGGEQPEDSLMPNVVCMNLQDAQNEIQNNGVFFSRSEDATGQGRNQINDSNWQVVGQTPEPGLPIGEGEALLFVVKYGEQPNPC
jgi:beta-lactam-binding protein with PASTA domain